MTDRRLNQYKGRLSPTQVAAGMNAAMANARRLVDDAERLLQAGSFPTAASLAALSIEEAGKVSILRGLALSRTESQAADEWRSFRSHSKKNAAWLLPSLVASGARNLEDLRPLFDSASDHPYLLDQMKQLGLYTDCLGDAHWSKPQEVVDESLARLLVRFARLFARDRVFTREEIELWVQYMGPVWKGPLEWMKKALAEWHAELVRRNLAGGDEDDMARFIWETGEEAVQQRDEADENREG